MRLLLLLPKEPTLCRLLGLPGLTACFHKRHSFTEWLIIPLIRSPILFQPGSERLTDSLTDLLIAGNQPPIISWRLPVSNFTSTWHFKSQ